jgi:hypothetical protein
METIGSVVIKNTAAALFLFAIAAGCSSWAPGRIAYWDQQVEELCKRDGGVTVYERVQISRSDFQSLWGQRLPTETTRTDSPYYWQWNESEIRKSDPRVVRAETWVKRRSDDKLLGKSVQFLRSGGDFRTGFTEATSFVCPRNPALSERVFQIEENGK